MYVSAPFIIKKLIDGMTRTIASPEFGAMQVGGSLLAKIGALSQIGSGVKGGLTLQKFLGGLGLYGVILLISTTI